MFLGVHVSVMIKVGLRLESVLSLGLAFGLFYGYGYGSWQGGYSAILSCIVRQRIKIQNIYIYYCTVHHYVLRIHKKSVIFPDKCPNISATVPVKNPSTCMCNAIMSMTTIIK